MLSRFDNAVHFMYMKLFLYKDTVPPKKREEINCHKFFTSFAVHFEVRNAVSMKYKGLSDKSCQIWTGPVKIKIGPVENRFVKLDYSQYMSLVSKESVDTVK